ncbi:hypothetical protein [Wukongibacter sp. M2B1]|uniref:hypothetical protein n=1 Tax=Wukongibacter sp. M2B1 TaxID=3088895 RepID=UPI003D7A4DF2
MNILRVYTITSSILKSNCGTVFLLNSNEILILYTKLDFWNMYLISSNIKYRIRDKIKEEIFDVY